MEANKKHKCINTEDEGYKSTPKWLLYGVGAAFALSVGFSFYGIKKCVPYADTLTILTYRYMAALIGVAIWLTVAKAIGKFEKCPTVRPKAKLYQNSAFYILFMIFQILSMYFTTSIEGAIVFSMVPIFAKILGRIILGERSTRLQMFFIILTVSALFVLIILNATDLTLNVTGIIIMTIGCIFMGFQTVSSRYVRGIFKPIEITTAIAIGGSIVFLSASLIRTLMRGEIDFLIEPLRHWDFIIWVSFLGIFCILLSAQFMAYMLAHMEIVQSSIFSNASTLISIIAGAVLLGEPLYLYHFICGAIIIAGVVGLMMAPTKPENAGKALSDRMNQ